MQHLDPLYIPLAGFNLIEASAGTGKTYTITGLYLRLVVEAGIPVDRILVVTYTNAATKELRDRIRERLAQIRRAFLDGRASEDDELATRLLDLSPDREIAIRLSLIHISYCKNPGPMASWSFTPLRRWTGRWRVPRWWWIAPKTGV